MSDRDQGRQQNVGIIERWAHVLGGGVAALVGLAFLLADQASPLLRAAGVALALLGLDFVVTGITGYCPLYKRPGWSTRRAHPTSPGGDDGERTIARDEIGPLT